MLTPVAFMDAVLLELERLGMHVLVMEHQTPIKPAAELINDIAKAHWKAGLEPKNAAAEIYKAFTDVKNKLIPHA